MDACGRLLRRSKRTTNTVTAVPSTTGRAPRSRARLSAMPSARASQPRETIIRSSFQNFPNHDARPVHRFDFGRRLTNNHRKTSLNVLFRGADRSAHHRATPSTSPAASISASTPCSAVVLHQRLGLPEERIEPGPITSSLSSAAPWKDNVLLLLSQIPGFRVGSSARDNSCRKLDIRPPVKRSTTSS